MLIPVYLKELIIIVIFMVQVLIILFGCLIVYLFVSVFIRRLIVEFYKKKDKVLIEFPILKGELLKQFVDTFIKVKINKIGDANHEVNLSRIQNRVTFFWLIIEILLVCITLAVMIVLLGRVY